jgi:hypothetical protein
VNPSVGSIWESVMEITEEKMTTFRKKVIQYISENPRGRNGNKSWASSEEAPDGTE